MGKKNIFRCSLRLSITAVLALGFLTGCSNEEPEPEFTVIPPTPKSTQTEDPAEPDIEVDPAEKIEPPELPPEVFEETVEGAEAAARFYLDVFSYSYANLETDWLEKISLSTCETCQMHIDSIKQSKADGETVVGGEVAHGEVVEIYDGGDGKVIVLEVIQGERKLLDSTGKITTNTPAMPGKAQILTEFSAGSWKIRATSNKAEKP